MTNNKQPNNTSHIWLALSVVIFLGLVLSFTTPKSANGAMVVNPSSQILLAKKTKPKKAKRYKKPKKAAPAQKG